MDLTPLDCNNIQKAHSKILSAIPLEALVVVVLSQKAEAAVAATLVLGARATDCNESSFFDKYRVWVLEVIVILDSENEKGNCNAILAICSRLGIGYWDLVGIGSKLHVTHMVTEYAVS
ncbi:hypothetical protein PVK06_026682 [Gossypium arboreum]|uniref:Uncharacterized protein n=1 Tax=Gossypium arboreum TaxID=29729 RepID=A0ABR0NYN6_GOSAR|nr:hypothetical protein PVK06_026682 [Gossypium arboreum]